MTSQCLDIRSIDELTDRGIVESLVAFREKDRNFVRVLLTEGLVDERTLVARIRSLAVGQADQERLTTWVTTTCRELG